MPSANNNEKISFCGLANKYHSQILLARANQNSNTNNSNNNNNNKKMPVVPTRSDSLQSDMYSQDVDMLYTFIDNQTTFQKSPPSSATCIISNDNKRRCSYQVESRSKNNQNEKDKLSTSIQLLPSNVTNTFINRIKEQQERASVMHELYKSQNESGRHLKKNDTTRNQQAKSLENYDSFDMQNFEKPNDADFDADAIELYTRNFKAYLMANTPLNDKNNNKNIKKDQICQFPSPNVSDLEKKNDKVCQYPSLSKKSAAELISQLSKIESKVKLWAQNPPKTTCASKDCQTEEIVEINEKKSVDIKRPKLFEQYKSINDIQEYKICDKGSQCLTICEDERESVRVNSQKLMNKENTEPQSAKFLVTQDYLKNNERVNLTESFNEIRKPSMVTRETNTDDEDIRPYHNKMHMMTDYHEDRRENMLDICHRTKTPILMNRSAQIDHLFEASPIEKPISCKTNDDRSVNIGIQHHSSTPSFNIVYDVPKEILVPNKSAAKQKILVDTGSQYQLPQLPPTSIAVAECQTEVPIEDKIHKCHCCSENISKANMVSIPIQTTNEIYNTEKLQLNHDEVNTFEPDYSPKPKQTLMLQNIKNFDDQAIAQNVTPSFATLIKKKQPDELFDVLTPSVIKINKNNEVYDSSTPSTDNANLNDKPKETIINVKAPQIIISNKDLTDTEAQCPTPSTELYRAITTCNQKKITSDKTCQYPTLRLCPIGLKETMPMFMRTLNCEYVDFNNKNSDAYKNFLKRVNSNDIPDNVLVPNKWKYRNKLEKIDEADNESEVPIILPSKEIQTFYNGAKMWVTPKDVVVFSNPKDMNPPKSEVIELPEIKYSSPSARSRQEPIDKTPTRNTRKSEVDSFTKTMKKRRKCQKCCFVTLLVLVILVTAMVLVYFLAWDNLKRKLL